MPFPFNYVFSSKVVIWYLLQNVFGVAVPVVLVARPPFPPAWQSPKLNELVFAVLLDVFYNWPYTENHLVFLPGLLGLEEAPVAIDTPPGILRQLWPPVSFVPAVPLPQHR